MSDIDVIENFVKSNVLEEIDDNTELVIHVDKDRDGKLMTSYYYVHHGNRSIFFLDAYQPSNLSAYNEIFGGPTSLSHLGMYTLLFLPIFKFYLPETLARS